MMKNNIQAILTDNGVELGSLEKTMLVSQSDGMRVLRGHELSSASRECIQMSLQLLWSLKEQKRRISKQILLAGESFSSQVKILITLKGITPLSALGFLADVADIKRFRTLRKMNAYLGLVPRVKESGGRSRAGHINRASRGLTRTLLTQSVCHIANASPELGRYYSALVTVRGAGRARIALIRKACGIMRRMLLNEEPFRWMKKDNYERKLKRYENQLRKIKEEKKSA